MKNIYIFGSNGQDGLLLSKQITIKFPIATQVLFSKKKVKVLNNLKIETYFFRDFLEYLNLIEEFLKKYPPDQIYYLAAVHYSSQEAISNIKDDQSMVFTNYFLPIHLINEIYRDH